MSIVPPNPPPQMPSPYLLLLLALSHLTLHVSPFAPLIMFSLKKSMPVVKVVKRGPFEFVMKKSAVKSAGKDEQIGVTKKIQKAQPIKKVQKAAPQIQKPQKKYVDGDALARRKRDATMRLNERARIAADRREKRKLRAMRGPVKSSDGGEPSRETWFLASSVMTHLIFQHPTLLNPHLAAVPSSLLFGGGFGTILLLGESTVPGGLTPFVKDVARFIDDALDRVITEVGEYEKRMGSEEVSTRRPQLCICPFTDSTYLLPG